MGAGIPFSALRVKHTMIQNGPIFEHIRTKPFFANRKHFLLRIEDSLHYQALLSNDYSLYKQYTESTNQKEHTVEAFQQLFSEFDLKKCQRIRVFASRDTDFFWVQDGVHRLAILKYKQIFGDVIPLELLHIDFCTPFVAHTEITDPEFLKILKLNKITNKNIRIAIEGIQEVLEKTVNKTHYNGWNNRLQYGYHSFDIYNIRIQGQRKPIQRLHKIKKFYDFTNKQALDFGCNTGGMLLHLPELKKGVGIDYDENCINAATYIAKKVNFSTDYKFIRADLNAFDFEKELGDYKPDILFLLSLGSWVKDWKNLYTKSWNLAQTILLETNNDEEGIPQLMHFKQLGARIQLVSESSDDDCTGNLGRKTYLIERISK
jgi:hypothetical protein